MSTMQEKPDPTYDELMKLILVCDGELLNEGIPPKGRNIDVPRRVMEKLGHSSFIVFGQSVPPILNRIREIHSSLYRTKDIAIGGIHGGFFMFRDIYCSFHIPIIFGQVSISPISLLDLNPNQLRWLQSLPTEMKKFINQFIDVFDFAGAVFNLGEYKCPPEAALELFHLAAFQFQSAAATLNNAFDPRGAIQSSILGAELALKGGVVATGFDIEKLKVEFGHNKQKAAVHIAKHFPNFNIAKVTEALNLLPEYVKNRYSKNQPGRIETGDIVMNAQFIAGEVMRSVSDFTIGSMLMKP